ncbi:hypothetical protein LINPERHAP1_LOCUS20051 [Linum perenne]
MTSLQRMQCHEVEVEEEEKGLSKKLWVALDMSAGLAADLTTVLDRHGVSKMVIGGSGLSRLILRIHQRILYI